MPYNTITSGFISKKLLSFFFSLFKHCGILVRGFMGVKEWIWAQKNPKKLFCEWKSPDVGNKYI